jgi:hypothetical protein
MMAMHATGIAGASRWSRLDAEHLLTMQQTWRVIGCLVADAGKALTRISWTSQSGAVWIGC